jgi:hypothetical protein
LSLLIDQRVSESGEGANLYSCEPGLLTIPSHRRKGFRTEAETI